MRKIAYVILMLLVCFSAAAQTARPKIVDLRWLQGCWLMDDAERRLSITEMWSKPDGGTMIGAGRTVKAGKTVGFEFLRITEDNGAMHYISRPSENREETAFKLVKWNDRELIFENLGHDFPQRIIYRGTAKDRLAARIEGEQAGKIKGIDFAYSRTSCE